MGTAASRGHVGVILRPCGYPPCLGGLRLTHDAPEPFPSRTSELRSLQLDRQDTGSCQDPFAVACSPRDRAWLPWENEGVGTSFLKAHYPSGGGRGTRDAACLWPQPLSSDTGSRDCPEPWRSPRAHRAQRDRRPTEAGTTAISCLPGRGWLGQVRGSRASGCPCALGPSSMQGMALGTPHARTSSLTPGGCCAQVNEELAMPS